MMTSPRDPRGITLLVAVVLSSVMLSVALSLLDISYKQVLLSSSSRQSQYAFYAADSALECALYWDQKMGAFDFSASSYLTSGLSCSNAGIPQTITIWSAPNIDNAPNSSSADSTTRTTTFFISCPGGGTAGKVTIVKVNSGTTSLYATGYSTCSATDPRRIERGLKVRY